MRWERIIASFGWSWGSPTEPATLFILKIKQLWQSSTPIPQMFTKSNYQVSESSDLSKYANKWFEPHLSYQISESGSKLNHNWHFWKAINSETKKFYVVVIKFRQAYHLFWRKGTVIHLSIWILRGAYSWPHGLLDPARCLTSPHFLHILSLNLVLFRLTELVEIPRPKKM